ncbi:MAG TPA: restriction endonuclease subunit S [Petrotoga sp.]|nr:MAG: Restriction modification system DNA specificity domain [Petrotoga mobilis]HBT50912.1 restriction endonuclease subunit S [Petrotoga sp.]
MAEVKEMEKLPEGWKRVRLGEIIEYEQPQKYLVKSEQYYEKTGIPVLTAGKSFILGYTDEQFGINNTIPTIIFDDFTTDSRYVNFPFKLKSSAIKILKTRDNNDLFFIYNVMQILNFNPGSEHKRYWISEYSKISIPFPPLPEQRKIAEILETVDNAIEKTDRIIEKYKRIKQGLMQDLLTKGIDENGQIRSEETHRFKDSPLGRIPEEWEVLELEKVAEPNGIVRGPFGGMLKKEIFVPRGYKVYEQGNAIYKSVKLGNYYIDSKKYKQMLRFAVKPKDFIISCSGTIGKIFMIPANFEEGIINQALLKITIDDKRFNHKFFEYFFDWDRFQTKIIDYTQGGAMQNLIGINEFKKIGFPKPPLPEQHRIASILSQIDETIEKEQRYKEKLERIKQGLMEDLLTGKVRVNHLNEGVENVS